MWPQAAFTTDVIVGFPGETEAEFQETLDFCEQVGFSRLHVFPYSPREGTQAATMDGQVDEAVKAQRVHRLIALGEAVPPRTARASCGQVAQVLLEEALPDDGGAVGIYPRVPRYVRAQNGRPGALALVRLEALTEEGMAGTVVEYLP